MLQQLLLVRTAEANRGKSKMDAPTQPNSKNTAKTHRPLRLGDHIGKSHNLAQDPLLHKDVSSIISLHYLKQLLHWFTDLNPMFSIWILERNVGFVAAPYFHPTLLNLAPAHKTLLCRHLCFFVILNGS